MKLTPSQSRRALGYGLIGIGGSVAGPAVALFYLWLGRRRKSSGGDLFNLSPDLIGVLWATFLIGAALALVGFYLIKSAKRL